MKYIILLSIFYLLLSCAPAPEQSPHSFQLPENPSDSIRLLGENLISTGARERDFTLSPDGRELMYTSVAPGSKMSVILHMQKSEDGWSAPHVAPFSGMHRDLEPAFHPDGNSLFFISKRPMPGDTAQGDYNIWRSVRTDGGGWGEAEALDTLINTEGDEFYPSLVANGNLYFTAGYERGYGLEDIYRSEWRDGAYQEPVLLDSAVNTSTYEFNAFIAPDESFLIFGSWGRPDGLGGGDLYLSIRATDGRWQPAVHLEYGINSPALDYCPFVDLDRGLFVFTSERSNWEIQDGSAMDINEWERWINSAGNGNPDLYYTGTGILPLGE